MTHSHDTATPALSVESEEALRPFANAVFNDNGDMTVTPVYDREAYVNAYFAHKRLTAPNPSPAAKGGEVLPDVRLDSEKAEEWPAAQKALWRVVTGENLNDGHYINAYRLTEKLYAAITARSTPSPQPAHPDDLAVDRFAVAMKAKLADARAKGKGGWNDETACSQQYLSDELRRHALKPDPLDVANFAMFLHQRNEEIATPSPQPADTVRERIARALNSVLGSKGDDHPRHHPAQNSGEEPSEVWWTQFLEAADAVVAALATPSPQPADTVREAAKAVIKSATNTYRKRNGQTGTIEGDDGEMAWIVPFDPFEELRAALASDPAPAGEALEPVVYEYELRFIGDIRGEAGWEKRYGSMKGLAPIVETRNARPLYAHPAPEGTARLREDLERVMRELAEENQNAQSLASDLSGLMEDFSKCQRERDDARKALETATDDRKRLVEAVSTFLGKGEHRDAVSCHYCGDTHGGNRCRSGGDHDFDPTGETIWEFEGKDVDTLRAALDTETSR